MRKFKTIKFSQLLASVRADLQKYDGEGMIDPSRLIKVVHRCNDIIGLNIYDHKECLLPVKNFKAELPLDFYKVEVIFAVAQKTYNTGLIATGNHYEWGTCVKNVCRCEGGLAVCVQPLEQSQPTIKYDVFIPLHLSNRSFDCLSDKSPCRSWQTGQYSIDIDEDFIHTDFKEGMLYMAYLSDMTDPDTGELLVPFHGRLNDYYEYSIKTKIFEDMMINTEADVINALQYSKRERNLSFTEAVDFATSKSAKEWAEFDEKRKWKLYNEFYRMFQ